MGLPIRSITYDGPNHLHWMRLKDLKVRMATSHTEFIIVGIDETVHYQYAIGNKQPYKDWLVALRHSYDSSLESFEHIMTDDTRYLEGKYQNGFIIHDDDLIIIDGVH
jgi:hypothetical protein